MEPGLLGREELALIAKAREVDILAAMEPGLLGREEGFPDFMPLTWDDTGSCERSDGEWRSRGSVVKDHGRLAS